MTTSPPRSPRLRGPSIRDIRTGASPISPRSPLWVEGGEDDDDGPVQLNLDCGTKQSIARSVANSPQRYSTAFASQVRARRSSPAAPPQPPPRASASPPRKIT